MVISDAFPQGFLPLPAVPSRLFEGSTEDHKISKKKKWLPVAEFEGDFRMWQIRASTDLEVADTLLHDQGKVLHNPALQKITPQPHNSINRETGTTGEGMFAPYSMPQIWFHPAMRFDLYAVIDEQRISAEEMTAALTDTGHSGYGRDASIGLGKFEIDCISQSAFLPKITNANSWLTLTACAPQGLGFDRKKCFYRPLTRFGRHGSTMALSGNPFKKPVLLAAPGGVFSPVNGVLEDGCLYIGQGLGGVSTVQPEAVSQGYAPVLPIRVEVS
jgi:CRISPR-associated protein Csm4